MLKELLLGEVVTNDLKRSITRETADKFMKTYSYGNEITEVSSNVNPNSHYLKIMVIWYYIIHITFCRFWTQCKSYLKELINNNNQPPSNLAATKSCLGWCYCRCCCRSSGEVDNATIVESGSGYTDGETLRYKTISEEQLVLLISLSILHQ